MFFVKRAGLYVKRKWGKTLTVAIILFIVSTLVLSGLLIKSASQQAFEVARDKLGANVIYTADLSSVMQNMRNGERPTERGTGFSFSLPEDYKAITTKEVDYIATTSKYVKNYTVSSSLAGEAVDFVYYDPSGETEEDTEDNTFGGRTIKNNVHINVVGVDVQSKEVNFNEDDNEIVEGRYFTDEEIENATNVIIIEKTIADLNDISIGETITIEKVDHKGPMESSDDETTDNIEITYEVVGIYKTSDPTDISSSNFMGSFNLSENTMYAPYTTILSSNLVGLEGQDLEDAQAEIEENGYEVQSVTFTLNSPTAIDAFIEEVKAMNDIDTTYRSLNANDAAYQQMVGPIENVAGTSTILVVVVVIAGAFIIGLLSMLSIKDRKYELGVLLSLGESRAKIVMQLISEMLIVSIVSFALATFVSNLSAQATTNFLLNQEIAATNTNQQDNNGEFRNFNIGDTGMMRPNSQQLLNVDVETINKLTVTLNGLDIIKMFAIGIVIIIIGNIIQAMFVLRCNPKEILLER